MPSEDVRITRSAGINFGVPNSEYRLRIDPVTGEALSCYNQDTDTEYIGGGGGDSDYSTAEVTLRATSNEDYDPPLYVELIAPIITNGELVNQYIEEYTESKVFAVVLYKGALTLINGIPGIANLSDDQFDISGDVTAELNLEGDLIIQITGDCTIGIGEGK